AQGSRPADYLQPGSGGLSLPPHDPGLVLPAADYRRLFGVALLPEASGDGALPESELDPEIFPPQAHISTLDPSIVRVVREPGVHRYFQVLPGPDELLLFSRPETSPGQ